VPRVLDYAHGRSGDKLNRANIGLVSRSPEAYELLVNVLTRDAVANALRPFVGDVVVHRYLVPSIRGLNFVVDDVLDGGSLSSRRVDRLAKAMSGIILSMPVDPACQPSEASSGPAKAARA
jgi:hypothetical protein